jgi:accessory gene regulator protein AgrB
MLVVQTRHAKRTRKYSILMTIVLLGIGSLAGLGTLLTLRWDSLPKKR